MVTYCHLGLFEWHIKGRESQISCLNLVKKSFLPGGFALHFFWSTIDIIDSIKKFGSNTILFQKLWLSFQVLFDTINWCLNHEPRPYGSYLLQCKIALPLGLLLFNSECNFNEFFFFLFCFLHMYAPYILY